MSLTQEKLIVIPILLADELRSKGNNLLKLRMYHSRLKYLMIVTPRVAFLLAV
jgi:hypothetical protein